MSLDKCNESLDNKDNVSRRAVTYGRTLLENLPFCTFSVVSFEGSLFPRFWIQNIFKREAKSLLFKIDIIVSKRNFPTRHYEVLK